VIRTLLLDLDGTLVHSVPDLAAALNRLLRGRGLAALSQSEVASMVGDGVTKLVERAFAARDRAPDAAAVAEF
jgi:phosphoglycolate phosphatase